MRCLPIIGSFLVGFVTLTSARGAHAQSKVPGVPQVSPETPAGVFGMRGQIALSSDEGVATSYSSTAGAKTFKFTLRPAIDYFIIDNLSVGAVLGIDYLSVGSAHSTVYSIGPRVGYNISFKPMFSVWPRVGLSYAGVNESAPFGSDDKHLQLNFSVPFMFHPLNHFFVGFGPAFDVDVTGHSKTTTIAGRVTLGGWF
jgi:hypothetical protein